MWSCLVLPDSEATGFHEAYGVLRGEPGGHHVLSASHREWLLFPELLVTLGDSLQWWVFTHPPKTASSLDLANRGLDTG